ncbi:PilN domain-containing protein [Delftia acidovorans]
MDQEGFSKSENEFVHQGWGSMALMTSDAKLFGLDLRGLSAELGDALRKLSQSAWLRRLAPTSLVGVWANASGPVGAKVLGTHIEWNVSAREALEKTAYKAVLLDPEQVLQRVVVLPVMAPASLRGAIELDVHTMTPFAPQDTLWAYAESTGPQPPGRLRIEIVIASRSQVEQVLRQQSMLLPAGSTPEVWAPASTTTVILPNFGESRRRHAEVRRRNWILVGLGCVLLLAVALAVTPTLQLQQRALDARQQFSKLAEASKDTVAKRQLLVEEGQELGKLQERLQQQPDHLRVLAALTEALPDDAATQRIVLRGSKLTIQGLTGNASNTAAMLAKVPGFLEVRLPTAVTRVPGSSKESFALEANIDPKVLGQYVREEDKPADASEEEGGTGVQAEAVDAKPKPATKPESSSGSKTDAAVGTKPVSGPKTEAVTAADAKPAAKPESLSGGRTDAAVGAKPVNGSKTEAGTVAGTNAKTKEPQ